MHDVHLPIHLQARFMAKQTGDPNIAILDRHIQETEEIRRQEQAAAGINSVRATGEQGAPLSPGINLQPEQPGAGLVAGGVMGAQMGGMNAGSPIPAQ